MSARSRLALRVVVALLVVSGAAGLPWATRRVVAQARPTVEWSAGVVTEQWSSGNGTFAGWTPQWNDDWVPGYDPITMMKATCHMGADALNFAPIDQGGVMKDCRFVTAVTPINAVPNVVVQELSCSDATGTRHLYCKAYMRLVKPAFAVYGWYSQETAPYNTNLSESACLAYIGVAASICENLKPAPQATPMPAPTPSPEPTPGPTPMP